MALCAFILLGLVIGLVAHVVARGKQGVRLVSTALFGLTGGFLGGLVGALFYGRRIFLQNDVLLGTLAIGFIVLFVLGVRARGRRRRAPF